MGIEERDEINAITNIPATPWAFFTYISMQHKWWMIGAIVTVTLASATSIGTSYFFKLIIDAVEAGDVTAAFRYGLLFPVAVLVVQLLYRLSGYFGMHWCLLSNTTAFNTLTNYTLFHSHNYFINRFAGSITNKFRNVGAAFEQIIPDFLWGQLNAAVTFIVTFILIIQVDTKAAWVFLGLLILLVLVNQLLVDKKRQLSAASAKAGTILQGSFVDTLSNMSLVRLYTNQEKELTALRELSLNKQKASFSNWGYTEVMLLINSFILVFCTILMFWFLVKGWEAGRVTTGDFVLVLALVSQITGTLLFVGKAFNALARVVGELDEALGDIILPFDITDTKDAKALNVKDGQIVFKDATFSFGDLPVFSNFSLQIAPKERIGIVGSSGAGKSTFVSLLLRQHELDSGSIKIDGQNIATATQDSLRKAIAIVPQEPALFHRTILENISYGAATASFDEVVEAAKSAQAHQFIMAMPEGYNTLVGERGIKLSGGQKQRIAIARAILKNAPILILDEATSALDSESESEIQKAFHNLMEGKTVIAIAHRLSTLREMDRIIVLDGGKISEDGTHDELLAQGGQYQRLWGHQAGGFLID